MLLHHSRFTAAALFALVSSLPLAGQCTTGMPTQLGTVTVLSSQIPGGLGVLPRTTGDPLRVACDGMPAIQVQLRVSEPDGPARGTLVLSTGAEGRSFYANEVGGQPLIVDLINRGYRVIDRSWITGWLSTGGGIRRQSCRYATLLAWVHDNLHPGGEFGAVGGSGGSAEVAYALSSWGAGAILDLAVLSGGPPMARLDLICATPPAAGWIVECSSLVAQGVLECGQPLCTSPNTLGICTSCSENPTLAELRADSVLHNEATIDYPNTRTHVIVGAADCTEGPPMAVQYYLGIQSEKVLEFVLGTPHWVATTANGRDAILRAVLGANSCAFGSTTLDWPTWPSIGDSMDLVVHGTGSSFFVYIGGGAALAPLGPYGWWFLGPPFLLIGAGPIDPVTRRGSMTLTIPEDPALIGAGAYHQAIGGACLSNLVRFQVLP